MEAIKDLVIPDNAVLIPIAGRVAIEVTGVSEGRYGPLWLPQQSAGDQNVGVVRQVYDSYVDDYGNTIEPMVEIGDVVVIGKFTGTKVELNRDTFIVCREMDILAVVRVPIGEADA